MQKFKSILLIIIVALIPFSISFLKKKKEPISTTAYPKYITIERSRQ